MRKTTNQKKFSVISTFRKRYSKTNLILELNNIFTNKGNLFPHFGNVGIFTTYPITAKVIFSLPRDNKLIIDIDSTGTIYSYVMFENSSYKDKFLYKMRILRIEDVKNFGNYIDNVLKNLVEFRPDYFVEEL